jgi:hypothetical protein
MIASADTMTCTRPSPKMSRRICQSRDGLSSSPMMNNSSTTPEFGEMQDFLAIGR